MLTATAPKDRGQESRAAQRRSPQRSRRPALGPPALGALGGRWGRLPRCTLQHARCCHCCHMLPPQPHRHHPLLPRTYPSLLLLRHSAAEGRRRSEGIHELCHRL